MRAYPSGLAVVTVAVDGERLGLTVASLVSLSLDPPLVGVAVSRHAALHELLREGGRFAASLLAADQADVAQHFARGVPPIAMWHGVAWREGETGVRLLEGAIGWLECELHAHHEVGDHTFFVGEVVGAERGRAAPPLLYVERRYATIA
jgi:flavin reductase (DIM6/NTAB) family NADH-FMN oxidoreductase RutF